MSPVGGCKVQSGKWLLHYAQVRLQEWSLLFQYGHKFILDVGGRAGVMVVRWLYLGTLYDI